MGYWKHQVNVYLSGKGSAQESLANMSKYMSRIKTHFNDNLANPVTIFQVPQPATGRDSLEALQRLLTVNKDGTANDRAKQQLIALMLNIVSSKLHQTTAVSQDGATASQAVTYCNELITDPDPSNDEIAKDIADNINNGLLISAGIIPTTTPIIVYKYKGGSEGDSEGDLIEASDVPKSFGLLQNYPNPFNLSTKIEFGLKNPGFVSLNIYDVLGRKVRTLVSQDLPSGYKSVLWDGKDDKGLEVASGIYFYRIQAGDFAESKRMLLLK